MKYILCFMALVCLAMRETLNAQNNPPRLQGKVISGYDQSPLPGATLKLTSGKRIASSNNKGEFSASLSAARDTLVISHVGFAEKRMLVTPGAGQVLVVLQPLGQLMDEVQVTTGYESKPKERATGSFVTVSNELLNRQRGPDILSRLDGVTSGLLFDKRISDDIKIQIRGLYSLSEKVGAPLIVVDNFPYAGDLNNINPNDIENVTILRDAAAASIWGAKAGNGVIVITTKKGRFNQRPQLSVSTNTTITGKPDLFALPVMPVSDQIGMETFLFDKGAYDDQLPYQWYYSLTPVVQILDRKRQGTITAAQAQSELDALAHQDVRNDFLKYLYRPAIQQQYALSLSGGTDNTRYILSGGYDKNEESLKGNGFERYTFRSDNTFMPVKNLQIQAGVGFTHTDNSYNTPGGFGSSSYLLQGKSLPLYAKLADDAGNPVAVNTRYGAPFTDTAGNGLFLDWKYRPLNELGYSDYSWQSNAVIGTLGLHYSFTPAFSAEIKYQYQYINTETNNNHTLNSFYTRDLVNQFSQSDGQSVNYIVPKGGILDNSHQILQAHNVRGQLNYHNVIRSLHDISIIAGSELRTNSLRSSLYRTYGYSDNLNSTPVDYITQYPVYGMGYNAYIPYVNAFDGTRDHFVSLYSNAGYSFAGKYLLSASARKDASNVFGVNANQKGRPFWSAGAGWIPSKESFYNSGFLPFLKLRATLGFSGNTDPSASAYTILDYRTAGSNYLTQVPYAAVRSSPNPKLRWERVRTLNLATDFELRNQVITGTIEYYNKKSTDVLAFEVMDGTTGISGLRTNSAHIRGQGVDLQLNIQLFREQALHYNVTAQLSYATYKITRYLVPQTMKGYTSSGTGITPLEGYNPYEIVSHPWAGLDATTGDPMGRFNGKATVDYDSILYYSPITGQVKHGSALPVYFGNLLQMVQWKNLSLSANITYRFAYYFRRNTISYYSLFVNNAGHSDYNKRWQHPGDEKFTSVPSMVYPAASSSRDEFYRNSAVTVEPGDHIRLNDARLNYSLNRTGVRRLPFSQLQVYAMCSNLNILLWKSNDKDLDPEYPNGLLLRPSFSFGINAQL